jgi:hypothetical protein
MSPEEIVARESRLRPRFAGLAVLAGVCLIIGAVLQLGGPHTKVDELTVDLLTANKRFPLDLIAAVVNGIAALAAASVLVFLFNSARVRNPDKVRPWIRIVAIVAGGLTALSGVVYAVIVAHQVHEFATTGSQTYQEANRLTSGSGLLALQLLGQAGALLVAVSFVLVSLQAMNQGLLSRFMGYLGMFAGALFLFQITQVPVVQCYWLLAIAYLLSGRWPTGVPPAWLSGRSEPWPSSAEMRSRRAAQAGPGRASRPSLFGPRPKPAAAPAAPEPQSNGSGVEGRTRATTPKRKRKRRG